MKTIIEVGLLDKVSKPLQKIHQSMKKFPKMPSVLDEKGMKFASALDGVKGSFANLTGVMSRYAVAAGAVGGVLFGVAKSVMDTAGQFERFQTILTTLEGSEEKAKKSMAWISDFAAKTPYEMSEVTDSFVKLKAYGLDPIKDNLLKDLGDTAAAMGKPVMQVVEAIGDAITGENERLKELGIKASKKGNTITYAYSDKDGKQHLAKVDANNREQIQKTLQTIWNSKYGGAMDKLSTTWEGMISNLSDQWARFKLMVADAGVFDFLKDKLQGVLDKINQLAESGRLKEIAENIGQKLVSALTAVWDAGVKIFNGITAFVDMVGGLENLLFFIGTMIGIHVLGAVAALAANLTMLGFAFAGIVPSLVAAIPAVWGFTTALLANPWTWAVVGLIALGVAVWKLVEHWDTVKAYTLKFWENLKKIFHDNFSYLYDLFMNFTPLGWIIQAFSGVYSYVVGNWESIKSVFLAAFEIIKSLFLNFTPLGWIIRAFSGVLGYIQGNWNSIKNAFSSGFSYLKNLILSFNPLSLFQTAFAPVADFFSNLWSNISNGFANITNQASGIQQSAGVGNNLAMPSAKQVLRGANAQNGRVDVNVGFGNVPKGTQIKTKGNNSPNMRLNQGITYAK